MKKIKRVHFATQIAVHPEFESGGVHEGVYDGVYDDKEQNISQTERKLMNICYKIPLSMPKILLQFGYASKARNIRAAVKTLIKNDLLEHTLPEKLRSKNQCYKITQKGKVFIESDGMYAQVHDEVHEGVYDEVHVIERNFIEFTLPDNPRSKWQRY